jgi:hypothetical protein
MMFLLLQINDVLAPLAHAFLRIIKVMIDLLLVLPGSAIVSSCDACFINDAQQSNCSKVMMLFLLLFLGSPVVITP